MNIWFIIALGFCILSNVCLTMLLRKIVKDINRMDWMICAEIDEQIKKVRGEKSELYNLMHKKCDIFTARMDYIENKIPAPLNVAKQSRLNKLKRHKKDG